MRLAHLFVLAPVLLGPARLACAQAVIGEMYASDAAVRGSVLFASGGTQIESGSSVSAGDAAALLKLKRGGEVRICPRTTVSVSSSANGRDLLWGMNVGSLEAHFLLSASADTVLTPDFRILLAGPGTFHFAISADSQGNACVKALPSNTASLIVSELNGDATYQVKPNEQVYFHGGHIANSDAFVPPECGCPPPVPAVEVAKTAPAPPNQPQETVPQVEARLPVLPHIPESVGAPSEPISPADAHLEMEAPFVYQAGNPDLEMAMAISRLRLTSGSEFPKPVVLPPAVPKRESDQAAVQKTARKAKKKGFFGKIGSFFSAIFR